MKNVIWFAVFLLGTAALIGSPLLLARLTLPPTFSSEVFHELATTPGVEVEKEIERLAEVVTNAQIALQQAKQEAQTIRSIRTKRSHSAPMPLKSYQDNDLIVAKTF